MGKEYTDMEYLSREAYDKIKAELDELVNVEFPRLREDLEETRAQGDLSENAGYHAAKRAHGKAIGRIRFLQNVLKFSRVIDTDTLPKDRVTLLSKVEATNTATGAKMTFILVSPHEMNLQEGKISIKSPIGRALMGARVGDEVSIEAPAGTFRLRIDNILQQN